MFAFSAVASLILAAVLSLCGTWASELASNSTCGDTTDKLRSWSLSFRSIKNESGEWMTFTALKDWTDSYGISDVDVKQTVVDCGGRKMVKIQGFLKDPFGYSEVDTLKFHDKTGPNAVLINKGYTVTKLKVDESAVVLTSRPLKPNELFEVVLDKRGAAKGYANGIGITTRTPNDGELPTHMNTLKSGTWLLYGQDLWQNNVVTLSKYTPLSIYGLKAGDKMGVMKSDTGALHFFINGVDQGPAASRIPDVVYGVYELYGDALQATMTKK